MLLLIMNILVDFPQKNTLTTPCTPNLIKQFNMYLLPPSMKKQTFCLLNKNLEGSGKRKLMTIDSLLILSFAAQTRNVNFPG